MGGDPGHGSRLSRKSFSPSFIDVLRRRAPLPADRLESGQRCRAPSRSAPAIPFRKWHSSEEWPNSAGWRPTTGTTTASSTIEDSCAAICSTRAGPKRKLYGSGTWSGWDLTISPDGARIVVVNISPEDFNEMVTQKFDEYIRQKRLEPDGREAFEYLRGLSSTFVEQQKPKR
jgi:hypothetical protein